MKKNIKVPFLACMGAFLIMLFNQCENDVQKANIPEILSFDFGYENTNLVNYEVILNVRASVIAEANVDKILLEIKPKSTSLWAFDSSYYEFSGLNNVTFNQVIKIPFTVDSCNYTIVFTVTDLAGNQVVKQEELQLIYLETPIIISFEMVNGFMIDDEGRKILATDKGVFTLNMSTNKYELVEDNTDFIPANDLALSKLGNLWITSNQGALNFNSQLHLNNANSELLNNSVNRISIDYNDIIYFATPEGISIKKNEEWLQNLGLKDLYSKFEITDLATASNGFTYATTNGGGVERFKVDIDGISGATVFDTDWSKLKSNSVLTVFIDDTIQAYGTDKGVAIHYSEYTKWDWENYTTSDGLINDTVLSILKDNSGNWWFGTAQGLSKLEGRTWTNYTVENHGIISNTIKFMAIDSDGSLWLATDKGLSHIENNQFKNY